jgi:hypothetical protein
MGHLARFHYLTSSSSSLSSSCLHTTRRTPLTLTYLLSLSLTFISSHVLWFLIHSSIHLSLLYLLLSLLLLIATYIPYPSLPEITH